MKAAALLLALTSGSAAAEEARWYLRIDNDVVFGTDRWYTSGVRLARVKDGLEFALTQEVYTPDAKNWRPGDDDRSPTARLLGSATWHGWGPGYFQSAELALGVRGPSAIGRQATETIHHIIPAPEVDWSRQLGDEVDVALALTRSQSIVGDRFKAHVGATLGNQITFAHAGFELRAGDAAPTSALLRFAPTPPFTAASTAPWSAYAGASLRVIARNELISQNYDRFGPELEPRRSVSRVAAGVAWTQPWGAVTFDLAQDSREFDAQHSPHRFGSLAVHVAF